MKDDDTTEEISKSHITHEQALFCQRYLHFSPFEDDQYVIGDEI